MCGISDWTHSNVESVSSIPEKEILCTITSCLRKFCHNLLTISDYIPIESLITCVATLCLGITIDTTSTYVNMAVWHFSVRPVRYNVTFSILCHHQSTLKGRISVVDLEWLWLHMFCPANWSFIAFLQFHSACCCSGSFYRWTMKICLPSPDQCRDLIWRDFFDFSCRNFEVVLSYPANSCYALLTDLIAKTISQWTISFIMHCCISGLTSIFITSHP